MKGLMLALICAAVPTVFRVPPAHLLWDQVEYRVNPNSMVLEIGSTPFSVVGRYQTKGKCNSALSGSGLVTDGNLTYFALYRCVSAGELYGFNRTRN